MALICGLQACPGFSRLASGVHQHQGFELVDLHVLEIEIFAGTVYFPSWMMYSVSDFTNCMYWYRLLKLPRRLRAEDFLRGFDGVVEVGIFYRSAAIWSNLEAPPSLRSLNPRRQLIFIVNINCHFSKIVNEIDLKLV